MGKQSRNIVLARQQKIIQYIQTNQSVSIDKLSAMLNVSKITIRRDLDSIKRKGIIERIRGGAKIAMAPEGDVIFEEKGTINIEAKTTIATCAAGLVEDGDTVFLNAGSTTLMVIKYLNQKSVRVVTNNAMAPAVVNGDNIELIITGGEFRARSKSLIGEFAAHIINQVYANKCILGADGFSSDNGIMNSIYQGTLINELMVGRCKGKCIVVADGSKIGKSSNFKSIDIQHINILVTDSSADANELERIRNCGVEVLVVD